MHISWYHCLFLLTAIFHLAASIRERKSMPPPGKLIDVDGTKMHLYLKGKGDLTIVLDHSLGGIEGYFLIDELAKIARVCICDRPGYGWSHRLLRRRTTEPAVTVGQPRSQSRCSEVIVNELDLLLAIANVEPPYILIGDSFGSYNMRLYAHQHPEKVKGIILTDGLHEAAMLNMPLAVRGVKYLFISGFIMSIFGSLLGIIRLIGTIGLFELIKPELKQFSNISRQQVNKSFYSHNHWLTMARELISLNRSGRQLQVAKDLNDLPVISIKSSSFFKPSVFTLLLPLKTINRLRDTIHHQLSSLSSNNTEIPATKSSHFVWIDEPEIIIQAVKRLVAENQ